MRAVGINKVGGPEVLEVVDLPEPVPGPGEVRVKVAAATVNASDTLLRSGTQAAPLAGVSPPYVPGMELSGTIDAVGGDGALKIGDRVIGIVVPNRPFGGAQAEQVVVPVESVVEIPSTVSFVDAATIPMNGLTALRVLDVLDLDPGQTLAITGAAGTVGSYIIQLARMRGLVTVGDASPADEELVRSYGTDEVVARGPDVVAAIRHLHPEGVDALVDAALIGGSVLGAVRDYGQLAIVRKREIASERHIAVKLIGVRDYLGNTRALRMLVELVAAGDLVVRVARTLPFEDASEAHRILAEGGVRGRIVLTF